MIRCTKPAIQMLSAQLIKVTILILVCQNHSMTAAPPNYNDDIKPLFRDHCLQCHNVDDANADLDLSSYAATLKGGSSGEVVKAGQPSSSQLYRAIAHLDGAEAMPPESSRLSDVNLKLVGDWIRGGLLEGRGSKSKLKPIAGMAVTGKTTNAPMPKNLPMAEIAETVRPPIPQAMAASPGAPLIAVSGHKQVRLFRVVRETTRLELLGAVAYPEGTIHDIKFSLSGTILMVAGGRGSHSGNVVLFDVESGKRLGEIGDEVDSVLAADISPSHELVALGGPQKAVRILNTSTGQVVHSIRKHTDWVTAVSFSPDGSMLATGDRSGGIHVWDSEKGAIVFTLDEHKVRIADLSWRPDGKVLASAADDGNVILWSVKDGFPVRNVAAHVGKSSSRYTKRTGVLSVNFAPNGSLITTGRDQVARAWSGDMDTLASRKFDSLPVSGALLNDGSTAVVGTFDGKLHVWSIAR